MLTLKAPTGLFPGYWRNTSSNLFPAMLWDFEKALLSMPLLPFEAQGVAAQRRTISTQIICPRLEAVGKLPGSGVWVVVGVLFVCEPPDKIMVTSCIPQGFPSSSQTCLPWSFGKDPSKACGQVTFGLTWFCLHGSHFSHNGHFLKPPWAFLFLIGNWSCYSGTTS